MLGISMLLLCLLRLLLLRVLLEPHFLYSFLLDMRLASFPIDLRLATTQLCLQEDELLLFKFFRRLCFLLPFLFLGLPLIWQALSLTR